MYEGGAVAKRGGEDERRERAREREEGRGERDLLFRRANSVGIGMYTYVAVSTYRHDRNA